MPNEPGGYCCLSQERDLRNSEAVCLHFEPPLSCADCTTKAHVQAREAISPTGSTPEFRGQFTGSARATRNRCCGAIQRSIVWKAFPRDAKALAIEGQEPSGLHFEHPVPLSLLWGELLGRLARDIASPEDECENLDPLALAEIGRAYHEDAWMVILTSAENKKLDKAGFKKTTPDRNDPWCRLPIKVSKANAIVPVPGAFSCVSP